MSSLRPARHGAGGSHLNGRHSTMLLCDDPHRQLVRQQRTVSPLEALFGWRTRSNFLGNDFFRIGDDSPSMTADTDEVIDASFGQPPRPVRACAPSRHRARQPHQRTVEALLQAAATLQVRARQVDTEHLLLALSDGDVVKTILGQFQIKVDDLTRQIESEAKRGDQPFGGEIGVSPRVEALRVAVASNELGHCMSARSTS